MSRVIRRWVAMGTLVAMIMGTMALVYGNDTMAQAEAATKEEMRGVWVASVYNIDYPSKTGLTTKQLKQEIITILDNVKKINGNAVFFQVRPVADALYKSELYPWSAYLTGTQGKAPADNFDPLAFMISEGKKRGIGVHAWINPYKVTRGSAANPSHDLNKLSANNPARAYQDIVVSHPNGELYFDPGQPLSRYLVLQGVKELVTKYDLAGIHYDDYFYPDKFGVKGKDGKTTYLDFNDQATYKKYGQGFATKEDWRRSNVDTLVKDTYDLVKSIKPEVAFGVSPAGVWANKTSNPLGSNTSGGTETYYQHYADTKKWVEQGWVDYIAPQIYWNIGFKAADYEELVKWWSNVCKDSDVKLYIGHAAYKVGDDTQSKAWMDPMELIKQVQMNRQVGHIDGSIFYGYGNIANNKLGIRDSLGKVFSDQ